MHMQLNLSTKRFLPLQSQSNVPLKKRRISGIQKRDLNRQGQFEDAPEECQETTSPSVGEVKQQLVLQNRFVQPRLLPILAPRDIPIHPQHTMVTYVPFIPRLHGFRPNLAQLPTTSNSTCSIEDAYGFKRHRSTHYEKRENSNARTTFSTPAKTKKSSCSIPNGVPGFIDNESGATPCNSDQASKTQSELDQKRARQPTYGTKLHARIRSEAPDALPRIQIDPCIIQSLVPTNNMQYVEEWRNIQHPHALLIPGGTNDNGTNSGTDRLPELPLAPPVAPGTHAVVVLGPMDVLLGRGGKTNVHVGNLAFRELCTSYRKTYQSLAKFEKQAMIKRILNYCRLSGVRFLAEQQQQQHQRRGKTCFVEVGDVRAFKKCSQLVREGTGTLAKLNTDESDSQNE